MTFDYFYGRESDLFSFVRIPKLLFKEERLKRLSSDAKILYGLLLDRMSLSAKNGWQDDDGRVYIIYTIDEVQDDLGCANKKAVNILAELEDIVFPVLTSKEFRVYRKKIKRNIRLYRHPNPNSLKVVYVIPYVYIDSLSSFDNKNLNWKFHPNDKRKIKRIKKRH